MKRIKFTVLPLLLLVTSLFLMACGDSQQGTGSGSQDASNKSDPCALLTKAQAEAVLGVNIEQPASKQIGPSTTCTFGPRDALNFLSVTTFDHTYTSSQFEAEWRSSESLLQKTVQQISGVGDQAFYADSLLNVLKGNNYFIVSLVNPGLSEQEKIEKLKQVATQITQKL